MRIIAGLAVASALLAGAESARPDLQDPIALVVERRVYTWEEVRRKTGDLEAAPGQKQRALLETQRLLLAKHVILYLMARREGFVAPPEMLAREKERQIRRFDDAGEYLKSIRTFGRSLVDYEEDQRQEATVQLFVRRLVIGPEVEGITERERLTHLSRPGGVETWYSRHLDRYRKDIPGDLWYAQLPLAGERGAPPPLAGPVREALGKASDLAEVARAFPDRQLVYVTPWPYRTTEKSFAKHPLVQRALEGLPEGGVTEPILDGQGEGRAWHLVRLVRRPRVDLQPLGEAWDDAASVVAEEDRKRRSRRALGAALREIYVWPAEVRAALEAEAAGRAAPTGAPSRRGP
ncbi:MAG: hypothetical protein L0216_14675 [Planctomycetales bacterium]|nr:hypothetical protein [Planctomycetales bacterium]